MNGSVSPQTLAGLYLHIPFCSAVCPYCDFAVQVAKPSVRAAYVRSLLDEVELWADWKRCIDTIYFGGGTPSLLQIDDLALIVETVRSKLPVVDVPKVFFEANPEDVTARELAAWRSLGVDVPVRAFALEHRAQARGRRPRGVRAARPRRAARPQNSARIAATAAPAGTWSAAPLGSAEPARNRDFSGFRVGFRV